MHFNSLALKAFKSFILNSLPFQILTFQCYLMLTYLLGCLITSLDIIMLLLFLSSKKKRKNTLYFRFLQWFPISLISIVNYLKPNYFFNVSQQKFST